MTWIIPWQLAGPLWLDIARFVFFVTLGVIAYQLAKWRVRVARCSHIWRSAPRNRTRCVRCRTYVMPWRARVAMSWILWRHR